jgi:hypothetical protein
MSASISAAATLRLSVKFGIGSIRKLCPENPNFLAIRQKYRAVYDATSTFLYCRRYALAIKVLLCYTQYFISLAVTFSPTINQERNFTFTLQQR